MLTGISMTDFFNIFLFLILHFLLYVSHLVFLVSTLKALLHIYSSYNDPLTERFYTEKCASYVNV